MDFVRQIILPLILTILLELIILLLFKEKRKIVYLAQIGMNCMTNISLNLTIYHISFSNFKTYILFLIVAEIVIIIVEMLLYLPVVKKLKRSFLYAFCSNIVSALIGFGIGALIAAYA